MTFGLSDEPRFQRLIEEFLSSHHTHTLEGRDAKHTDAQTAIL